MKSNTAPPKTLTGLDTRPSTTNDRKVANTENQNPEGRSRRSPTVAAARSGVVASDKIHSAKDALRVRDSRQS